MRRKMTALLAAAMMVSLMAGCQKEDGQKKASLDPSNPVAITVWHYYNGSQQAAFDQLVEEFNATVGEEQGIYVEGFSQGSVSDLEKAITDSVDGVVGAEELPDIFSSYADTAYAVEQKDKLVDLTKYFSEDELSQYVDSYVQEGYFNNDGALYLCPVAKSTEILMMNRTDWEPFEQETGTTTDELLTVEGITEVAQRYYEWTDAQTPDIPDDGKAFYGRDSMANYFVIGMKQMGIDLFDVQDGKVTVNEDKEALRRLWENYYVPYVKGYFTALGRFRSDDVKTGDILAYTGSSSSAMYFPDEVETDDGSYQIDYMVQTAPVMKDGQNYRVQQGAGMAVTKSDEKHEYAACVFLKWFTQKDENLQFVCDSAYLPVLKEANNVDELDNIIKKKEISINQKAYDCLVSVMDSFDDKTYYTTKNFENGYAARNVLESNLSDRAVADREKIDAAVAGGASREDAVKDYITDESFESWYTDFCKALEDAVGK